MNGWHRCTTAVTLLMAGAAPAAPVDPLAPVGHVAARVSAARTPPMGWSSWNAFRTEITEDKVIGSARALVTTGLAARGYRYVNIDDGWWQRRDDRGRLQVRTGIFPSAARGAGRPTSLRLLVDRLHGMGLKAGLYTDAGRNACSQAYDRTSPNLPQGTVLQREVGSAGHVDDDMRLIFGEWAFDYIKVDACGLADYAADRPYVVDGSYRPSPPVIVRGQPARTDVVAVRTAYAAIRDAIRRHDASGQAILSICTWGQADVRAWGKDVGNTWRTGEDIVPSWASMLQSFDTAATRALYAHPGAWNDPDMLFVGTGDFDAAHLVEARSHLSLWALAGAPLMIGYDLRQAPASLVSLLGNAGVIAIDQDAAGNQGVLAYDSGNLQIIVKTLSDGRKAVGLLNRTATPLRATLTAAHLAMAADAPIRLQDLWDAGTPAGFTNELPLMLAPHETRLLLAAGRHELGAGRYLSELPGSINVAVDGVTQPELDPTIFRGVSPWSSSRSAGERPLYTGWGGAQADRAVHGTTLTVAGQSFAHGIGILSGSRMEVGNTGAFRRLDVEVGIDDSTRDRTTAARFLIYGDGRLLADSGAVRFGQAARQLRADVRGVRLIELVARGTGGDATALAWGNARFTG